MSVFAKATFAPKTQMSVMLSKAALDYLSIGILPGFTNASAGS